MDKTPQKFTKDPKRQEAARKGRGNYMNKALNKYGQKTKESYKRS